MSVIINPRGVYFREFRIRSMANGLIPTDEMLREEMHSISNKLLFYLPMNDSVGNRFTAIYG